MMVEVYQIEDTPYMKERVSHSYYTQLLERLGYRCWRIYELHFPGQTLYYEVTKQMLAVHASKHEDLFKTLALVKTLEHLGVDTLPLEPLED